MIDFINKVTCGNVIDLIKHIPNHSVDLIIADPFLGRGTTLVACKMLDRNGIGFELNPNYEKLIKHNLDLVTESRPIENVEVL